MVSKSQIKLITSLQQKKYRKQEQLFIAEGIKVVQELLHSNFELLDLYTTKQDFLTVQKDKVHAITADELKKISALTTPNTCLAVFKIPKAKERVEEGLIIALDDVRDPGNLGTIIRLCDWFGVATLFCSEESVDVYNPKVVQATMGSISRVNVMYGNLETFLLQSKLPVFGTFMDGKSIYQEKLPKEGIIVMGNEANGISSAVEKLVTKRIAIPRFGNLQVTESLNVATATAIILSEFKRG
ncbi:RNA methyltransferase [Flavobacterium cucumis]|uniref:RNA methyltransferase, TrmH family n=1 Tax=Flavobacterium cucumis TaxID=416016 RepID=A0A1M7ZV87_9FLAO|nr:RNA methyltransferase [Flavobacterium cucumis]SHO72782.1 RNA methyltransferase, TrmH family [Flavobacterium cucumis]